MFRLIILLVCTYGVQSYFTLNGKCPENVKLQEDFRLADFYGKWHQTHHYSSDGQHQNNCSILELVTRPSGVYLNQSRVDRGLFHRYSEGRVEIPFDIEDSANLGLTFVFDDAPRRLKTRKYSFRVLATNYKYFATVYTCQYSPLINKHYIYVWLLSRNQILNDVSKELAVKPLQQLGVSSSDVFKDDLSKCSPKYYKGQKTEPLTFRYPVPV